MTSLGERDHQARTNFKAALKIDLPLWICEVRLALQSALTSRWKHRELLILPGFVLLCKSASEGMNHDFTVKERDLQARKHRELLIYLYLWICSSL